MKKLSRLGIRGFALAILFAVMVPINAPACLSKGENGVQIYNGAWEPTDTSVFAIELGLVEGQVHIYDFGTPDNQLDLFAQQSYSNIYFTEITGNVASTGYADTTAGGQSLLLGDSADFGISFSDENGTWFDYSLYGSTGTYTSMDLNTDTALIIHDAEQVDTPLPGAIFFLSFGLFGVAVIRIRSRQV